MPTPSRKAAPAAPRPGPGRPRKLTREKIVEAAIAVMEREGFAALSTRSLARELGTTGSTLYNYVERIEDIETEALRSLISEMSRPTATTGPALRAQLLEHLMAARRLMLKHPRVAFPAVGSPSWQMLSEFNLAWYQALARYAGKPYQAVIAYTALISTAFATSERERILGLNKLQRHKLAAALLADVKLDTNEDLLGLLIDQLLPGLSRP